MIYMTNTLPPFKSIRFCIFEIAKVEEICDAVRFMRATSGHEQNNNCRCFQNDVIPLRYKMFSV